MARGIRTPEPELDLPAPRCPKCKGFRCIACGKCDCAEHQCTGAHYGDPKTWKDCE